MTDTSTSRSEERATGKKRLVVTAAPDGLSQPARRTLAHIHARTTPGRFACPLYDMPTCVWDAALDELRQAGYPIHWTYGQVADKPAVTGGYVLARQPGEHAR